MQYAVHLTVRGRVQAFRVRRKSSWMDQVGTRERERENPFHLCCQSVPRELLRTRTGTQDSMNWPSGLQRRTLVLKQDISRFSNRQLLQS